jgi:hypothetical protein
MIDRHRNVAFVASTMPFELVIKYHKSLDIGLVVCASESLRQSYQKGFNKLGVALEIKVVAGNAISRIFQLLKKILVYKKTVIFHECCWWELDLLILITKTETLYFPQVTLANRRKVDLREIPLKSRVTAVLKSPWFDYYETELDGGGGRYTVPALKNRYRLEANVLPVLQEVEPRELNEERINRTKRVLILSGRDLVPDSVLIDLYGVLISRLLSSGVEVHTKDHPNPAGRLNQQWIGARTIDCDLPLECLNLGEYCAVIGVVSTGLKSAIAGRALPISIAHLLPAEYADELDRRMLHLKALNVFPWLPKTVDELLNRISSI